MMGFCSNCRKIWTLGERQGICQWCGNSASCQSTMAKPRRFHSRRNRKPRQVHSGGNGYEGLPEPYLTYYTIAKCFAYKALVDDRDDLLHSIIEGLAKVGQRKADKGEDFSEPAMYRTAEHTKDHYWYRRYSYTNGLDCQHCSREQRAQCRHNWSHGDWSYSNCHRAIRLESLNQPITDSEGNVTELGDLIADDKALDLAEWIDARTFLIGAPVRLKAIAMKKSKGESLTGAERKYLTKLRRRSQKTLV